MEYQRLESKGKCKPESKEQLSLQENLSSCSESHHRYGSATEFVENGKAEPVEESMWKSLARDKLVVIINICFVQLCAGLFYSMLGPFFPQEAADKGLSSLKTGAVFSTLAFVEMLAIPLISTNMTRIGVKVTYGAGTIVAGSCAVCFGFLNMLPDGNVFFATALIVRSVEAVGIAASQTSCYALITHTFPERATSFVGALGSFYSIGFMMGPVVGGILFQYGGFGAPFWSSGGTLTVIGIITLLTFPQQQVEQNDRGSIFDLLRLPLVLIMAIFAAFGISCVGFLDVALAVQLKSTFGFSPAIIGVIFFVSPCGFATNTVLHGWIADKKPQFSKPVLIMGCVASAIGFTFLGPAPFLHIKKDILWLYLTSLFCIGSAVGSFVVCFHIMRQTAITNGFEESLRLYGLLSGVWNTFISIGTLLGPIISGALVDNLGFSWTAFIMAAICVVLCFVLITYMINDKFGCKSSRYDEDNELTPIQDVCTKD